MERPLAYTPGNAQHLGSREEQQDSFAFSDLEDDAFVEHGGVLAVLADGMGGIGAGGLASEAAVRAFLGGYLGKRTREPILEALTRSLEVANRSVCALGQTVDWAGTTLVAIVMAGGHLYWVSVGDSRAYLIRDEELAQLTVDHNHGTDLDLAVAKGRLTSEQSAADPQRESLTSHLGQAELVTVDLSYRPLRLAPGDIVLLASDGFYHNIEPAAVLAALGDNDPQPACEELLEKIIAGQVPDQDNATVAAIKWTGHDTTS